MNVSDLIGMPYTKEHDCKWLASVCSLRAGRKFPEDLVTPEDDTTWAQKFKEVLAKHYIRVDEPTEGTLAIFAIPCPGGKVSWHCGIVTRPGWMITTKESLGVYLTRLSSVMWKVSLKGYYEYKD